MVKRLTALPYLVGHKGRWYFRRHGQYIRLPAPDEEGFLEAYTAAKSGQTPKPSRTTVKALIASYEASSRWDRLSPRSRQDYTKVLRYLDEKLGQRDVSFITRPLILEAMEANRHRARFANYIAQIASVLCEHAIDLGWRRDNPVTGVRLLALGEGWEAWPEGAQAAFREKGAPGTLGRSVFELARGTGQRIADVLKMRRDEIDGDGIWVDQNKKKKKGVQVVRMWVPFTDELIAYLPHIPKRGLTLIAGNDSRPVSYRAASYAVMQVRSTCGATAWTIHGLRSNRASELYEAGCTDAEVQAITGHASAVQARKYGRGALQRRLASAAVEKMRERNGTGPEHESVTPTVTRAIDGSGGPS